MTHSAGVLNAHLGLFISYWRNPWFGTVPASCASNAILLAYLSLWIKGVPQLPSCVPGFSYWCFCYGYLLADLLVKGTKSQEQPILPSWSCHSSANRFTFRLDSAGHFIWLFFIEIQLIFNIFLVLAMECSQRSQWHLTPVLLPGKSHGQRSLVGCSPWGR